MAKSVDPDQMLLSAASDLGPHSLNWHVCPNTINRVYFYKFYKYAAYKLILQHFFGIIIFALKVCDNSIDSPH